MSKKYALLAVGLGLIAPASLAAQDLPATTGPAPSSTCEIHVWPAEKFNTLTEGAIWNNSLDSAFNNRPRKSNERGVPIKNALDAENQLKMLSELGLPTLLRNPGAQVIVHNEASKRRGTGSALGRQVNSGSTCYMELTVAKNFFNRSNLTDRTLRTMFVFDDYGDQPMPKRSFTAWGSTDLVIFPAKDPALDDAANEELGKAFMINARQFAGYAFAVPKSKK